MCCCLGIAKSTQAEDLQLRDPNPGNELDGLDLITVELETFELGEFNLMELVEGQVLLAAYMGELVQRVMSSHFHSLMKGRYSLSLG